MSTFKFRGPRATATRPAAATGGELWAKNATSAGSNDGTVIDADLMNDIVGNLRRLSTALGQPTTTDTDDAVRQAVETFVAAQIAALIDASPGALNTLNELAAALGDDANFAASMTTALAGKQPLLNQSILVNGDFQINQRQFAGGSLGDGVFGFDRWKGGSGTSISVSGFAVTLTGPVTQKIVPSMWGVASLASTQITVSLDSPDAEMTITWGSTSGTIAAGSGRRSVTLTSGAGDTGNVALTIRKTSGGSVQFSKVKAEFGAVATPWTPRPFDDELRLCQRFHFRRGNQYAQFIGGGFVSTTTTTSVEVQYPVEMHAVPTISVTNVGDFLSTIAGVNGTVSGVALSSNTNQTKQRCQLIFTHGTMAGVAGQGCNVQCGFGGAGSYGIIDFSAEP